MRIFPARPSRVRQRGDDPGSHLRRGAGIGERVRLRGARARDQALEQHFAPARAEAERERARLAELARRDASGNGYDATRGGGGALPVDPATRGGAGVHALLTHARFGGYDPALANHFGLGAGLGPGVSARSVSRTGRWLDTGAPWAGSATRRRWRRRARTSC